LTLAESIFRKDALDRMANPERLDLPLRLVPPAYWLVLAAFAALALAAIVWASATTAPVRIAGQGILIDKAGLSGVAAGSEGQITALRVAPGQMVQRGDVIALLSRTDLNREIADTRARLEAARGKLASLSDYYAGANSQESEAARSRLAGIERSRAELSHRAALLDERARRIAALAPRGFVRRDEVIAAEIAAAEARERISDLDATADQIRIESVKRGGESRLALIDARNAASELDRQRQRLAAQLAEQTSIRAPHAGRVVELQAATGDVVAPGSRIATIARSGATASLIAIAYVPAGAGKRIRTGMEARIAPRTVERAAYGEMRGRVTSVSTLPATRDGMRQSLRNDQLVDQLLAGGAVVEVRLSLDRDPATASGYAWTSRRGPDAAIEAGTLCDSAITVDRKRLIGWLLPGGA